MSRLFFDFAIRAYVAGLFVGVAAPVVGSFVVQRRLSLIGDTMGHVAFAGVALGVGLGLSPEWGALAMTVAGAVLLERMRVSGRLASDMSLALLSYFGIAVGLVLLSALGHFDASALGVLFGSIFATTTQQVVLISVLCVVVVGVTALFYKELLAVALDEETARASGLPVELMNTLLVVMVALLIAAGMRVVGLLLMASLFVIPVAAGSRLSHSFRGSMRWAVVAGVCSAQLGLVVALLQGSVAPGGAIVIAAVSVFVIAAIAGRGVARRHSRVA